MPNDPGACPRCGEWRMMHPPEVNALSRLSREPDDESIWICSDCGSDEALEQIYCQRITPQRLWPVPSLSFGPLIRNQRMTIAAMQVVAKEGGADEH